MTKKRNRKVFIKTYNAKSKVLGSKGVGNNGDIEWDCCCGGIWSGVAIIFPCCCCCIICVLDPRILYGLFCSIGLINDRPAELGIEFCETDCCVDGNDNNEWLTIILFDELFGVGVADCLALNF